MDELKFTQPDLSPPTLRNIPEPRLLHRILFGDEGLRAGWGILLFVLLCFGSNYGIAVLHLLPSQPHATPGQPSPELPPASSIVSEGVLLLLVSVATLILSRIEGRPIGAYGLGGPGRLRLFLYGLFWGLVLLSLLVLVLWRTHLLVFDGLLLAPAAIFRYAAVWSFGFLLVALFEETFLRGYLQFTLTRGLSSLYRPFTTSRQAHTFGYWSAAIVLCSIFGFGHSNNPGESPFGLFAVGLFGLTLVGHRRPHFVELGPVFPLWCRRQRQHDPLPSTRLPPSRTAPALRRHDRPRGQHLRSPHPRTPRCGRLISRSTRPTYRFSQPRFLSLNDGLADRERGRTIRLSVHFRRGAWPSIYVSHPADAETLYSPSARIPSIQLRQRELAFCPPHLLCGLSMFLRFANQLLLKVLANRRRS